MGGNLWGVEVLTHLKTGVEEIIDRPQGKLQNLKSQNRNVAKKYVYLYFSPHIFKIKI